MKNSEKRYTTEPIRHAAEALLVSKGLTEQDAHILVDSMLEADMCGVGTHGIRMLPSYISKIDDGHFDFEDIAVTKTAPAFTTTDCKNNIGAISACKATEIAIENARKSGLHIVFAKNCNTLGPAFYFAEKMANEGLIGFVCCNSPAAMPAYNGLQVMLGTNPLAFACPTKSYGNISLDMATSIVAKSRFQTARAAGEKLPDGWALDCNGNPTNDPLEAIKGFILPMAGFKGYGIAMMIDILSGFLSGAGYLNNVGKFYSQNGECMNVGQLFVAIDPAQIYEGDFYTDMDTYIETLRNSKCVPDKTIAIPGDDRVISKKKALESGIVLSDETVDKLKDIFKNISEKEVFE